MRRVAHRLLIITLLAAHAIALLSGPAHHAPARSEVTQAADGQDARIASSHDDCPICHFKTQGQVTLDPGRDICVDVVQVRPTDEPPPRFVPAVDRPSIPRAPPLS